MYILALNNHNEEVGMKKLAAAVVILSSLSGSSVWAHEAGEFFIRAGSATVRPTEGAGGTLGSLGGFNVSNNTQLGLTFTYMATDNIGVELLAATPFRHKVGTAATGNIATVHHLPPTLMDHKLQVIPVIASRGAPYSPSIRLISVKWPQRRCADAGSRGRISLRPPRSPPRCPRLPPL